MTILYYIIIALVFLGMILAAPHIFIPIILVILGVRISAYFYFKSEKFLSLKNSISEYISECNDLNAHIESLRNTFADFKKTDYGTVEFQNTSKYNYKKAKLSKLKYSPYIYDCSKTVCDGARKQPFKYICKYFNIKSDESTLENFENVLNNFLAAEEGKILSRNKRNLILSKINSSIPFYIKTLFNARLQKELGFSEFVFDEIYFPSFSFRYTSAGGNSGNQFNLTMNIENLERFIKYLSELVKFKKSAEGQRRLMTPALRSHIIERDDHTCQLCGNSIRNEPNLLLEVDHIVPIAKGGLTSEDNLQTLCWKCNRHKGAKLY